MILGFLCQVNRKYTEYAISHPLPGGFAAYPFKKWGTAGHAKQKAVCQPIRLRKPPYPFHLIQLLDAALCFIVLLLYLFKQFREFSVIFFPNRIHHGSGRSAQIVKSQISSHSLQRMGCCLNPCQIVTLRRITELSVGAVIQKLLHEFKNQSLAAGKPADHLISFYIELGK